MSQEKTKMKKMLPVLLAVVMIMGIFSALAEGENPGLAGMPEIGPDSISGTRNDDRTMVTSVVTEPFYEGVTDEKRAGEAVEAILKKLGGDESTQLLFDSVNTTDGLTEATANKVP